MSEPVMTPQERAKKVQAVLDAARASEAKPNRAQRRAWEQDERRRRRKVNRAVDRVAREMERAQS